MRFILSFCFFLCTLFVNAQSSYLVTSATEFNAAQDQASFGDTIVWASGTYLNIRMDINKDGLIITADTLGTVLFSGVSRTIIKASNITFSGFQYIGGFIGNLDVIRVYGSDILISHINIQNYTSFKYLRVYENSRRTTISYCNFENRVNLDDQNILSILVGSEPGYHKIQHCSFKNFRGVGLDEGIEPIRIGVSSQGDLDSRTLVEYCYFTMCNGDGEIISHKSRQNVYRYNTFENNPVSELVLRHGDEGIVYGNFFINGMGGIRIREGSKHFIYNNYFQDLDRRSIWLMNDPADPLSDIHIYHNTFTNTEEVRLGGSSGNPPSNVIMTNNVFAYPSDRLFSEENDNVTWNNNLSFGNLGINLPATGLSELDPGLYENQDGYFQPLEDSPLLEASSGDYPEVPLYPAMEYDHEILFDLMQEDRPENENDQAIGASEFSESVLVKPHATKTNTGPSYLFNNLVNYLTANASQLYVNGTGENRQINISSNIDWTVSTSDEWISTDLTSGSGGALLDIMIDANTTTTNRSGTLTLLGGAQSYTITIFQDAGDVVNIEEVLTNDIVLYPNPADNNLSINNLSSGVEECTIEIMDAKGVRRFLEDALIVQNKINIDLGELGQGLYILKIKFADRYLKDDQEIVMKFLKN